MSPIHECLDPVYIWVYRRRMPIFLPKSTFSNSLERLVNLDPIVLSQSQQLAEMGLNEIYAVYSSIVQTNLNRA